MLGIGHFIWYKAGGRKRFDGSLPKLVKFYAKKDVRLPKILRKNAHTPQKNKAELDAPKSARNADIMELEEFLLAMKEVQIEFIFVRLRTSLEAMMTSSVLPAHVKSQFERVSRAKADCIRSSIM